MDGLIPMVYKVIRRSNTRRKYECLSSESYNLLELTRSETPEKGEGFEAESRDGHHHRRRSGGDVNTIGSSGNATAASPVTDKKPQLVRFHSHRV